MKSYILGQLLQRTAFEAHGLKHFKYTYQPRAAEIREYFKRILSGTSILLSSSLKCSVYQTARWRLRKVLESAARRYLKVHTGAVALSKCDRDAEEGAALVAPYFGFTVIRRARQRCLSTILYSGIRRPFTLLQNSPPWHLPSASASA